MQRNQAAIVVIKGVPKPLTYRIGSVGARVGCEVEVELGSRRAKGWVVDLMSYDDAVADISLALSETRSAKIANNEQLNFFNASEFKAEANSSSLLKPIISAIPVFSESDLRLYQWMSTYYGYPLAEIIDNAVPKRVQSKLERVVKLTASALDNLRADPSWIETAFKRAPLQAEVIKALFAAQTGQSGVAVGQLESIGKSARAAVNTLEKKALVEIILEQPEFKTVFSEPSLKPAPTTLTSAQLNAEENLCGAIQKSGYSPFLLFGVTGSGKTEVYLRAIEKALGEGGSALLIVPEIALTPQLLDQFTARLNLPLGMLHSQVGAKHRWEAWSAALQGKLKLAIGARSAIFTPLQDLKLIIVDEEHEHSYKQSENLRYNARDVAVMRAKLENCSVVLGSATPSFESLFNARKGRYTLLEMPKRATKRPVPQIEIVDLSKVKKKEMISENISPPLHEAICETLKKKGQVVILYNRRGFSSYLQCDTCGEAVRCPNCSVSFTYHKGKQHLLCHYCNLTIEPPSYCAHCRGASTSRVEVGADGVPLVDQKVTDQVGKLSHRGAGTEKVVEELAEHYPQAKILRMDRDTVSKKGAYREILGNMRSGHADILVGTQMIAKGHDLPGVTLVGIIDADVGLHLPDFRSSEKVFQLITQAAGRAGRGDEPGRVLVQTREPNHPTIVATASNRFKAFARYELDFRQTLGYPPFGRLLRLVISSTDRQDACQAAIYVRDVVRTLIDQSKLNTELPNISLLGPAPAPHEKLRTRFRWHIIVKTTSAKLVSWLATSLYDWRTEVKQFKDFRLSVDVDPVDML